MATKFRQITDKALRLCLKTRSGFQRLIFRLTVPMYIGSCIDDITNIACFAVFARRKTVSSRADDGVFRQSLVEESRSFLSKSIVSRQFIEAGGQQ